MMIPTSRAYRFVQVDVFTNERFGGNQLAVFTDARGLDQLEMQNIAREMNYSESTFVFPPENVTADARVRIFTPATELPFAGHPTVGTAWVLGSERGLREMRLELKVGTLNVSAEAGSGGVGSARMEQPAPTFREAGIDRAGLARLLGLEERDVHPALPIEFGSAGVEFLYAPLASMDAVRRARLDLAAPQAAELAPGHPAVYLFSTETVLPGTAAHARMLSQLISDSVAEDPATGSAAGPLGAYLVRHGAQQVGTFTIEQGYEMGRPSQIEVVIQGDRPGVAKVHVGGGVVRVAEGELFV
jgi:trans-2,3-dihydro-3-hydroxyanthranilate isomerase